MEARLAVNELPLRDNTEFDSLHLHRLITE